MVKVCSIFFYYVSVAFSSLHTPIDSLLHSIFEKFSLPHLMAISVFPFYSCNVNHEEISCEFSDIRFKFLLSFCL